MREFDDIAGEWDEYRQGPSKALSLLCKQVAGTDRVLDAGCGNGNNLVVLARKCAFAYGVDSSRMMVDNARRRMEQEGLSSKVQLFHASITGIPLPGASVERVFCLAVLHHLKQGGRLKALEEFRRVVGKGGTVAIAVWRKGLVVDEASGEDRLVPWKKKDGAVVNRYYHFFGEQELKALAEEALFRKVETFFEKNGRVCGAKGAANFCAVLRP